MTELLAYLEKLCSEDPRFKFLKNAVNQLVFTIAYAREQQEYIEQDEGDNRVVKGKLKFDQNSINIDSVEIPLSDENFNKVLYLMGVEDPQSNLHSIFKSNQTLKIKENLLENPKTIIYKIIIGKLELLQNKRGISKGYLYAFRELIFLLTKQHVILILETFFKTHLTKIPNKSKVDEKKNAHLTYVDLCLKIGDLFLMMLATKLLPQLNDLLFQSNYNPIKKNKKLIEYYSLFIINNNSEKINAFWVEKNVKNEYLQKALLLYIQNVLAENQRYIFEKPIDENTKLQISNSFKKENLKLGNYILSHFIEKEISNEEEESVPGIFKKVLKKYGKNQVYILEASDIILNNVHDFFDVKKPYYTLTLLKFLRKSLPTNPLAKIYLRELTHIRHNSIHNTLEFAESKIQPLEIGKFKIVIQNLFNFLKIVEKAIRISGALFKIEETQIVNQLHMYIRILYNIDLSKRTDINKKVMLFLLKFSFDFNSISILAAEKEIKALLSDDYDAYKEMVKICQNILQKKIVLMGFITNAILQSPFKYFYINYYFDGRGRCYLQNVYLNIQTVLYARGIVTLYQNENERITRESLVILKEKAFFKFQQCQNDLDSILKEYSTTELFNKKNKELLQENIMKEFKIDTEQKEQEFLKVMQNEIYRKNNDLLHYVIKNAKKDKQVLSLWSFINLFRHSVGDTFIPYMLDSSNSGMQMQTIMLSMIENLKKANLYGTENYDAYSQIMTENILKFLHKINDIVEQLTTVFPEICNKTLIINPYRYNILDNFSDTYNIAKESKDIGLLLKLFCMMDLEYSPHRSELLEILLTHMLTDETFKNILKNIKEIYLIENQYDTLSWLIKESMVTLCYNCLPENYEITDIKLLLLIRRCFEINKIMNNYPELSINSQIWSSRAIGKKLLMPYLYSSTSYTRKKDLEKILVKLVSPIKNNRSFKTDMKIIGTFIDDYFLHYVPHELNTSVIERLKQVLRKNGKVITISNKFFTVKLHPIKQETVQVETPSKIKGKRGVQLRINQPTLKINAEKLESSGIPNICHSCDAFCRRYFYVLNEEINSILRKKRLSSRNIITHIHDNFWSNNPLLLRVILKEVYLFFNHIDYFANLDLTLEDRYFVCFGKPKIPLSKEAMEDALAKRRKEFSELLEKSLNPFFVS